MTILIVWLLWCILYSIEKGNQQNQEDYYEIKREIKNQTKEHKPKGSGVMHVRETKPDGTVRVGECRWTTEQEANK